jgi:hypothetical protein
MVVDREGSEQDHSGDPAEPVPPGFAPVVAPAAKEGLDSVLCDLVEVVERPARPRRELLGSAGEEPDRAAVGLEIVQPLCACAASRIRPGRDGCRAR